MTYTAWAEKVGVNESNVRRSVQLHAEKHGLPLSFGGAAESRMGRPRGSGGPSYSDSRQEPQGFLPFLRKASEYCRRAHGEAQFMQAVTDRLTIEGTLSDIEGYASSIRTILDGLGDEAETVTPNVVPLRGRRGA